VWGWVGEPGVGTCGAADARGRLAWAYWFPTLATEKSRKNGARGYSKKHTSGAEARVHFIDSFAGDESPAYRPNRFKQAVKSCPVAQISRKSFLRSS